MKKSLFILSILLFVGCKFSESETKRIKELNDVKNLFIINPSENEKKVIDEWVKVFSRNISLTNEKKEVVDDLFISNSPTFYFEDTLPNKKSRSGETNKIREVSYKIGEKKTMQDPFDNRYYTVSVVYEGEFCYLWVEDGIDTVELDLEEFAKKFDEIYKKQTNLSGSKFTGESVKDGLIFPNKKISIVLYDIKNQSYLGYFSSNNYSSGAQIEAIFTDIESAFNEKKKSEVLSTICHEFSHLLTHVNKYLKKGLLYETWYTELLAMISEDFFKDDLNVSIENSSQARFFSFVNNGSYVYGFKNWQSDAYMANSYANAYTFGAFLARNYGGAELFYEIFHNDYVNEESIVRAVNKVNKINITFNDLLKEFCYILVNIDNSDKNLPSLNKSHSFKIGEFTYSLSDIGPDDLPEGLSYKVEYDTFDSVTNKYLGSYGFNYLRFDSATDVTVSLFNKDLILEWN